MKFNITVMDVTGAPLSPATVTYRLNQSPASVATSNGQVQIDIPVGNEDIDLQFSHPEFWTEKLTISPGGSFWNNKCCEVGFATEANIRATLSKVREAPTVYIDDPTLLKAADAPNAILTTDPNDRYAYRGFFPMSFTDKNVKQPGDSADPPTKFRFLNGKQVSGKPDGAEWERFVYGEMNIDPQVTGRYRFVEYKYSAAKIFLIALWVPKHYFRLSNKKAVDYYFFVTPTTAGKPQYALDIGNPPYGLKKSGAWVGQPFANLGSGYLFNLHYVVHQIIGSRKQMVVALPVNNAGDFTPVVSAQEFARTCRELNHYLHKSNLLETYYVAPSLGELTKIPLNLHKPIPLTGNIAVTAFSQSVIQLNTLMGGGASDALSKEFYDHWKEIWDVDSSVPKYLSWTSFLDSLSKWYKSGDQRQFRLIHSDYTDGGGLMALPISNWFTQFKDSGVRSGTVLKSKQLAGTSIRELHENNMRWSMVHFSESYITADDAHQPSARPEFISDQHQAVPNLGIGFCAALSGL
ncbi:MAG: hypothetical protein JSS38_16320 [Nitrospira sp.]|nr:hypothetical protein [Nitrospira sp.]